MTGRRLRQLQFISEFISDVRHNKGEENIIADYLSRPLTVNVIFHGIQTIDLQRIAQEQQSDPQIRDLQEDDNTSLKLVEHYLLDSGLTLLIDIYREAPRVVSPSALHKHAFDAVHSISHPGIRASRKLIAQRFVWKGMNKDIANSAKACFFCQPAKIHRHNGPPLQSFLQPDYWFSSIDSDLVGPLSESSGRAYLLAVIDRFTRHLQCKPLREITAKACADAFLMSWVARFVCPQLMTCDRGTQFTFQLLGDLCAFHGRKLVQRTAFHPESKGFLERQHCTLKAALKAQNNPRDWYFNLGFVLFGLRSTPKVDIQYCSN